MKPMKPMKPILTLLIFFSLIPHTYANQDKAGYVDSLGRKSLPSFAAPETVNENSDILILGNSLTHHDPSNKVEWFGDYGMAASARSNDYSHQLLKLLNIPSDNAYVRNLYPLEINSAPLQRFSKELNKEVGPQTKTIIIQLGDNVPDAIDKTKELEKSLLGLFNNVFLSHPQLEVFCLSTYWGKSHVDQVIERTCKANNAHYIYIGDIFPTQNLNKSRFEHNGVNMHPKDKEMRKIAEKAFENIAIQQYKCPNWVPSIIINADTYQLNFPKYLLEYMCHNYSIKS